MSSRMFQGVVLQMKDSVNRMVGVLDADQSLFAQDYRAKERTFSLITQVVGRAGRRGKQGRAIIQT